MAAVAMTSSATTTTTRAPVSTRAVAFAREVTSRRARSRTARGRVAARAVKAVTDVETSRRAAAAAARVRESGATVADRVKALIKESKSREGDGGETFLASDERTSAMRVMGCASASWIEARVGDDGTVLARCASESDVTRGFGAILCDILRGGSVEACLALEDGFVDEMEIGLGSKVEKSRANGFKNMLETAKKQLRAVVSNGGGDPFPSLIVTADEVLSRGSFAASQASYLEPDEGKVRALVEALESKKIGVVAHFYMDPEVQGILMAAKASYPHIAISDSLVMADLAVKMVESGCETIGVLGVDFMSENVRHHRRGGTHRGQGVSHGGGGYRMLARRGGAERELRRLSRRRWEDEERRARHLHQHGFGHQGGGQREDSHHHVHVIQRRRHSLTGGGADS